MAFKTARSTSDLHGLGFVHRDIRLPNILRLPNGSFILIDFENSGKDGDIIPAELAASRVMDPEVVANHKYTSAHDMYQVGKLIEGFPPQELLQLRN